MIEIAQNPKVAGAVGALTTASGAGQWFNWIPSDIGKFGVLVGAILSVVLIIVHLHKHYMLWQERKNKAQIDKAALERINRDLRG